MISAGFAVSKRTLNVRQAINYRKKSIEKYTDECPHTYDISTY